MPLSFLLLLSSAVVLTQNLLIPLAYANNNHQPINGVLDQLINPDFDKTAVQQILQHIQSKIAQTSGKDKATSALNQIILFQSI
jgi:hypothetical protein